MNQNQSSEAKAASALHELLSFAPPEQLRKTIQELFFTWITEAPILPENYKQISEDVYFLMNFLETVSKK